MPGRAMGPGYPLVATLAAVSMTVLVEGSRWTTALRADTAPLGAACAATTAIDAMAIMSAPAMIHSPRRRSTATSALLPRCMAPPYHRDPRRSRPAAA